MKRGFLVKAASKNKGLSDRLEPQVPQPSKPKGGPNHPTAEEIRHRLGFPATKDDLSSMNRLPYGNLTEQERALPKDYDKNAAVSAASTTLCKTMPHTDDGDGSTQWIVRDQSTEKKVLNTPGYPSRKPKPRRPDLCEVKTTEKMGQGLFAKYEIKRGEVIFAERPLLLSPSWIAKIEPQRRYTTKQSHQIMMFENEKVLEVAVRRMKEHDRADFMALCNSHTNDGTGPLMGIVRTNAFAAEELSEDADSPLHYSATCKLGSRLNHSCRPNVTYFFEISSFSYQFISLQNIKPGEELYCSYFGLGNTKTERQTKLAPYGFSCNCLACVNATPASDELRKTYEDQVSSLEKMRTQPELMANVVVAAKVLEAKMIAEGLDGTFDFFTVLLVIYLTCDKLERRVEVWRYQQRIVEYAKIHVHEKPTLQPFLELVGQ